MIYGIKAEAFAIIKLFNPDNPYNQVQARPNTRITLHYHKSPGRFW